MSSDMQTFDSAEFGTIRTTVVDDIPYFAGKDIASALGYSNTAKAIRDHVDDEDKLTERIVLSGQNRELIFINESGLYSLILSSKLPSAREFKRWVTSSVLPMIRRTGIYAAQDAIADGDTVVPMRTLTPEDYLAAARLIAACKNDRLKIVLSLLAKGGWDVEQEAGQLLIGTSTSDIGPRLKAAREEHNLTRADLSAKTGISAEVLRAYEFGRRFPKPDRYAAIIKVLDALDLEKDQHEKE